MDVIYMDNAATTWPKPEVVYQAIDNFNRNLGANPGRGSHKRTLEAGMVLLDTREALARLFNIADSCQIVYTANVTEALNLGIKGLLQRGDHVITTSMEHNSVARPLYSLQAQGVIKLTIVSCRPDGTLNPHDIQAAIQSNTRLIVMMHASNLTGTIMPIKEVGNIARQHGIPFMVDSAQTAGVLPIDVEKDAIDLLAFTGHKGLLGPQGTGGLYIQPGIELRHLKEGGTGSFSDLLEQPTVLPDRYESGTQNGPGIAGLGAGVNYILERGLLNIRAHEQHLTNLLLNGLAQIPEVIIYGPRNIELQTAVVSINIAGMDCGELSMYLDHEYGIITRSGLHCTPLAHRTIGTLDLGTCRLSPGLFSTETDIEKVIKAVHTIARLP
ncbi:MAG: aminotransferase class V-fold PLP-dependent enzyme [Methylocystaceae bacterium]